MLRAIDGDRLLGFYTLSASSIPLDDVPAELRARLPRYALVPAFRLGRLAVDERGRGLGLGEVMIFDAATKANASPAAVYALTVDAKDERVAGYYRRLGFQPLPLRPLSLMLPLSTFRAALR